MTPAHTWRVAAAAAATLLAVALSIPPLRELIERSMVWHMVVQMPLLVLSGWLWARAVRGARFMQAPAQTLALWNRYGLTGFMLAQVIAAYWMLPLAIDRAVVLPSADAMKLLTLFIAGAALRHSMQRAPLVLQLFFVGYSVSMLLWLGLYFTTTDLRLCNAYSLDTQAATGGGIVALGLAIGGAWLVHAVRASRARPAPALDVSAERRGELRNITTSSIIEDRGEV